MAKSIKIRAKSKDGVTTVKCLLTHPMQPSGQKNKKTGKEIPAHFIQGVDVAINGKVVVHGMLSGGISKNPYLSCKAKGNKGDTLSVSWVDNKGNKDSAETKIK